MPLAVRGGGHSAFGHGTGDDVLVIDLSQMKGIRVDPDSKTVRAEPGLTWSEFDRETQAFGLAVTGGRFSTIGIAGLTLGSGSGWLERRCGLTVDNLLSADVVLADGSFVRASRDENEDLFWALRGGSGNFGIVTSFEYQLHDIGPIVYGGLMAAPIERAAEIVRFMRDYMVDAPNDLGGAVACLCAPAEPFIPADMHHEPVTGIVVCWTGDHAEGERVVAPIREFAQPLVDMVQPMPYTAVQSMFDSHAPHGSRAYVEAEFIDEMTDELIDKLADHAGRLPGPLAQLLLQPMGGAVRDKDNDDAALGHREAAWCYHALALWSDDDQETSDAHHRWAREMAAAVRPHIASGVFLNFVSDASEERVRSTFGREKYARLEAIKEKYDPTNLFHMNQNIPPRGSG
jgi:FAD/FMN-containing dehydrogenase